MNFGSSGDKDLFHFLLNAPKHFVEGEKIRKFQLQNGDYVHCVLWNMHFYITGTDIVKILVWRFQNAGRQLQSIKKFEEGVFSDLRNLKPGIDATLEGPRSDFLEFLYKNGCIRTQKKQKVFYWYSVPHDALFCDALERDLRRETNLFTYSKYMSNMAAQAYDAEYRQKRKGAQRKRSPKAAPNAYGLIDPMGYPTQKADLSAYGMIEPLNAYGDPIYAQAPMDTQHYAFGSHAFTMDMSRGVSNGFSIDRGSEERNMSSGFTEERNMSSGFSMDRGSEERNMSSGFTEERNMSSGFSMDRGSEERNMSSGFTEERNMSSGFSMDRGSEERNMSSGFTEERSLSSGFSIDRNGEDRNMPSAFTMNRNGEERNMSNGFTEERNMPGAFTMNRSGEDRSLSNACTMDSEDRGACLDKNPLDRGSNSAPIDRSILDGGSNNRFFDRNGNHHPGKRPLYSSIDDQGSLRYNGMESGVLYGGLEDPSIQGYGSFLNPSVQGFGGLDGYNSIDMYQNTYNGVEMYQISNSMYPNQEMIGNIHLNKHTMEDIHQNLEYNNHLHKKNQEILLQTSFSKNHGIMDHHQQKEQETTSKEYIQSKETTKTHLANFHKNTDTFKNGNSLERQSIYNQFNNKFQKQDSIQKELTDQTVNNASPSLERQSIYNQFNNKFQKQDSIQKELTDQTVNNASPSRVNSCKSFNHNNLNTKEDENGTFQNTQEEKEEHNRKSNENINKNKIDNEKKEIDTEKKHITKETNTNNINNNKMSNQYNNPLTINQRRDNTLNTIYNGNIKETIYNGNLKETIYNGNLKDTSYNGNLKDTLLNGNLKETIYNGNLKDTSYNGNLKDTSLNGNLKETIYNGNLKDTSLNAIYTNTGNLKDTIYNGNMKDTIYNGNLKDTIYNGNLKDTTYNGNMKDSIHANLKDTIYATPQINIQKNHCEYETFGGPQDSFEMDQINYNFGMINEFNIQKNNNYDSFNFNKEEKIYGMPDIIDTKQYDNNNKKKQPHTGFIQNIPNSHGQMEK